jgi:hypothetical protein
MSLIKKYPPAIDIIKSQTIAQDSKLLDQFMYYIEKIYQYEFFKPMMDLVTTKCMQSILKFKIMPKQFYELDEGNCMTVEEGARKSYTITIKKITSDVIIHEIGHMIEKESGVQLDINFKRAIFRDLELQNTRNISLKTAIKNIMVAEVAGYPDTQKASELFTRYFQIIAMAKEVAGHTAQYGYSVTEVYRVFSNMEAWTWDYLYKDMIRRVDANIAQQSLIYIKKLEDIRHPWANEKVTSMHKEPTKPTWSKSIKSIKN